LVAEVKIPEMAQPSPMLDLKCLCNSNKWRYDWVTHFWYCVDCKRCSGRDFKGSFNKWALGYCFQCGEAARTSINREKKVWCSGCGAWQYNSNGVLVGNKFEDDKVLQLAMQSLFDDEEG